MNSNEILRLQIIRRITINGDYGKIRYKNNVLYLGNKPLNIQDYLSTYNARNKTDVNKEVFTAALFSIADNNPRLD